MKRARRWWGITRWRGSSKKRDRHVVRPFEALHPEVLW